MIDYTTVSKSTVSMPPGKWIEILNNLSMDNCLKFNLDSLKRANSVRSRIQGSLRRARAKKLNIHYKVRGQTVHNPDKSYTLYIWKDAIHPERRRTTKLTDLSFLEEQKETGQKETEVEMELKDQLFKLFSEGISPHDEKAKALVGKAGTRNLYYAQWKREGNLGEALKVETEDANQRTRRLGFKSNEERHKWIIEHKEELLDYAAKYGHKATLEKFHIGNATLRKLRRGGWATEQPTPPSSVPEEPSTLEESPKTPENLRDYIQGVVVSTNDFFAIKEALLELGTLKTENAALKLMLDKWKKLAGKLNTDIDTMVRGKG